jgi:pimeloyl-ACP methyl ester carboxylesterase
MVDLPGLGGVNRGLARGLLQPVTEGGHTLAQALASALASVPGLGAKPVFLAGHSLGGCLAQLFARHLAAGAPGVASRVQGVFTFGACTVGDAAFARRLEDEFPRCPRYVLGCDVIARLPPRAAAEAYQHAGQLRLFTTPWLQRWAGSEAGAKGVVYEEAVGRAAAEAALRLEDWAAVPASASRVPAALRRSGAARLAA